MKCLTCGETLLLDEYSSYTGIRHGRGWNYKCPNCQTDMVEVKRY